MNPVVIVGTKLCMRLIIRVFCIVVPLLMNLYFDAGVPEGSPPSGRASGRTLTQSMTSQSQSPSDVLLLCKLWSSTAITFRVTRINPCPGFVFTIKDFPILITDDILRIEMICAVRRDDNTKALIDVITECFPEDARAGFKTSSKPVWPPSGSHIWISEPTATPCDPTSTSTLQVAKSTTTNSGYTYPTVTISQTAFMEPSKAKGRRHSSLYHNLCHGGHVRCISPAIPR